MSRTVLFLLLFSVLLGCSSAQQRIVFGSCMDQNRQQIAWNALKSAKPVLAILMGDNVYGDTHGGRDLSPLKMAYETLEQSPAFQSFQQAVPIFATWDDHDYGDNDAGADFRGRKESERLFLDFWGVPIDDERRSRAGIYFERRLSLSNRIFQFIMLDTRSFRSPLLPSTRPGPGTERYLPDRTPGKTMLGEKQWQWLQSTLKQPADVRVLVSSIQVLADEHGYECWNNLPRERERLLRYLTSAGPGALIILSGDRHMGALYRHTYQGREVYEATSSALNMRISNVLQPRTGSSQVSPWMFEENYGELIVQENADELRLSLVEVRSGAVKQSLLVPLGASPGE
ncbi:MAG: alkaline phosphatase D family protein [Myxococcota bacterium]|nr:alkaline phosphatase D family protein [Myxococcota bacterium]